MSERVFILSSHFIDNLSIESRVEVIPLQRTDGTVLVGSLNPF